MTRQETPSESRRPLLSRRAFVTGVASVGAVCCAGAAWELLNRDGNGSHQPKGPTVTDSERRRVQPDAIIRVDTRDKVVAMTFDDGPDPQYTPAILDALEAHGARATFFMIGVNARHNPDIVHRALAAGHQIGNHTMTHDHLELLDRAGVDRELEQCQQALIDVGAPPPTIFRPPRGYTDRTIADAAAALHLKTAFWSVAMESDVLSRVYGTPPRPGEATIASEVQKVVDKVGSGMLILAHDGGRIDTPNRPHWDRSRTAAGLPLLLQGLHDKGFKVVDIATLLTHQTSKK